MKRAVIFCSLVMLGCSLGLDPNKIGGDGGVMEAAPPGDAGPDAPPPPNPDKCTKNEDCKPNNPCLQGSCDTGRGVCLYDVCPSGSCKVAACDDMTKTCGAPQTIGFHVASFKVGNLGCGGAGRRCFAAVHPFVFVGTTSGVVAYAMATPGQTPAAIPVGGVPFLPSFVVASGTRVYFVGAVVGSQPMFRIPIAWLDVPGDPTVKKITAQTAFMSSSVGSVERVYPTEDGGIYLVNESQPNSFPMARAIAPLNDLGDIQFFPSPNVPSGSASAGATGARVLFARQSAAMTPHQIFFDLENGAGTGSAQNGGEMNITMPAGDDVTGPHAYAHGPDGMIVWQAATAVWPMGMTPAYVKGTRLFWLVPNKTAVFSAMTRTDVETYDSMLALGLGTDVVGPLAVIDQDRVLALGASSQNVMNTSVRVATKSPMPSVDMGKSFVLSFAPSALAAASSGGWGYVLTPEPTMGAGPQVHIFAPGCP